jgi:hypothetical protein
VVAALAASLADHDLELALADALNLDHAVAPFSNRFVPCRTLSCPPAVAGIVGYDRKQGA